MAHIRKVNVANGIYWVEIPEADLRILCGAPADSVKHVMRRGLIVPTETQGVLCESGPNAILLSDLALQNGAFSNLAEFPVLQMLYRQGMAIPNHPNNTGAKPLLIGHRDQIDAQMNYIYRGNYGLVSEEEIIAAGLSEKEAKEHMRIKLKFAFGSIKSSEEFLDSCVVREEPMDLPGGASIRRTSLNVFEISFKDESVEVNLNLKEDEIYESPYPLGFHQVKRQFFSVVHSGNGDGWDINNPCMSSIIVFQGAIYLVDASPNVEASLKSLGIGINEIDGIFHTHSHDDHFAGITSLIRGGRRLKYYATPLIRASVTKKLCGLLSLEERDFAEFFDICDLEPDRWNQIGGLEVKPQHSPHPVENNVFTFRVLGPEGYRTYAHMADITSFKVLSDMVTDDPDAPGISNEQFEKIKKIYLAPASLKKIDAGGGMIHGEPEDFRGDQSAKIILSHRASDFDESEKEIGSGAPFGTMDELVPSYQNFIWRNAYHYLRSYFPSVDPEHLRSLINNEIVVVNPEEILLREGEEFDALYLVITGTLEAIAQGRVAITQISAGALLGETAFLRGAASDRTYRSTSFAQALKIPAVQYLEFVRANALFEELTEIRERQAQLSIFPLLDEGIPQTTFTQLVRGLGRKTLKKGDVLHLNDMDKIHLIKKGRLVRVVEGQVFETLGPRDFFGEETAIFKTPSIFAVEVIEDAEVYTLPGEMLRSIPVVRWKLQEVFDRRRRLVLNRRNSEVEALRWRNSYRVSIQEMDAQHKVFFQLADAIMAGIASQEDPRDLVKAVNALVDYAQHHFADEEALLERYSYPTLDEHKTFHQKLIVDVERIRDSIQDGDVLSGREFNAFFSKWMIDHILSEDMKYGRFLNDKQVF